MKRNLFSIILVIVSLCACAVAGGPGMYAQKRAAAAPEPAAPGRDRNMKALKVGGMATAKPTGPVVIETVDGTKIDLRDHLGKDVVVLVFWSTFCKPCKAEMPFYQGLHEMRKDRGLFLLAVSVDTPETEAEVQPFISRNGYTFPVYIDRYSMVSAGYNPKGAMPYLLVFNRDGEIEIRKDGVLPGEQEELLNKIDEMLSR